MFLGVPRIQRNVKRDAKIHMPEPNKFVSALKTGPCPAMSPGQLSAQTATFSGSVYTILRLRQQHPQALGNCVCYVMATVIKLKIEP